MSLFQRLVFAGTTSARIQLRASAFAEELERGLDEQPAADGIRQAEGLDERPRTGLAEREPKRIPDR